MTFCLYGNTAVDGNVGVPYFITDTMRSPSVVSGLPDIPSLAGIDGLSTQARTYKRKFIEGKHGDFYAFAGYGPQIDRIKAQTSELVKKRPDAYRPMEYAGSLIDQLNAKASRREQIQMIGAIETSPAKMNVTCYDGALKHYSHVLGEIRIIGSGSLEVLDYAKRFISINSHLDRRIAPFEFYSLLHAAFHSSISIEELNERSTYGGFLQYNQYNFRLRRWLNGPPEMYLQCIVDEKLNPLGMNGRMFLYRPGRTFDLGIVMTPNDTFYYPLSGDNESPSKPEVYRRMSRAYKWGMITFLGPSRVRRHARIRGDVLTRLSPKLTKKGIWVDDSLFLSEAKKILDAQREQPLA